MQFYPGFDAIPIGRLNRGPAARVDKAENCEKVPKRARARVCVGA